MKSGSIFLVGSILLVIGCVVGSQSDRATAGVTLIGLAIAV